MDAAPGAVLTAPGGSGAARGCGGAAPWHAGHLRRSGRRRLGGGGGGAGAGAGGGSAQRPRSRAASGQRAGAPLPASSAAKPAGHKRGSGASRRGAETKRGQGRRAGSCGRRKGLESRADSEARALAGLGVCGERGRCGNGGTGREEREREREKHKMSITEGAGGGPAQPAEPRSAKTKVGVLAAVSPQPAALASPLPPRTLRPFNFPQPVLQERARGQLSYTANAHWGSGLATVPEEYGDEFGRLQPTPKEQFPKNPHPNIRPQTADGAAAAAAGSGAEPLPPRTCPGS